MAKADAGDRVLATNRKALFHYEVLERAEAGLALVGTEVKSIRDGGFSFSDSWVELRGGELMLVGCRIAPYSHGNLMNHAPERDAQAAAAPAGDPQARRARHGARPHPGAASALPEERPREAGDRPRARQAGARQARHDPQEGRGADTRRELRSRRDA